MTEDHPQGVLEPGYRLLWYRIGHILGRGAFGTTYLAEDVNLHRPVAIKEFFPSQYCSRQSHSAQVRPLSDSAAEDFRWAMERFLSEARTLARFEHPNIIRVINIFEENGTAYMVMHYENGISLSALLKKRRTLGEHELARITIPILDGLEKVHASGFIHRDIKPSNIYIREGGTPVLIDFGSARQSMQEHTQTLTSLVSPGYAPIEQYTSKGERQGPWTDIYGMGATLYRAVTGLIPPSAVDRSEALSEGKEDYMTKARELVRGPYSESFLNAIDHALAFSVDQRPRSIAEWRPEFGFNLADIDTQPDYSDEKEPGVPPSQSLSQRTPAMDSEANGNPVIDITGTKTRTAVLTEPTVQADSGQKHIETEGTTEILPGNDEPGRGSNRSPYLITGAAAGLLIAAIVFFSGREPDSTAPAPNLPAATVEPIATMEYPAAADAGATADPEDTATTQAIAALLAGAREDVQAMRLTTPADNNAHDKLLRVLELDPDNSDAQRTIERIYRRYLQLAQRAVQENEFDRAGAMLDRAASVLPDGPGLMRARVRLEQRRTQVRMQALSDTMQDTDEPAETTPAGNETGGNEALRRLFGR